MYTMKHRTLACTLLLWGAVCFPTTGQGLTFPPFTRWYQNPLGFEPVKLHTANGLIIPAGIALIGVILTQKDTSLLHRISVVGEGGTSWGYYPPYTTMYQANGGLLFHARRWLSIGVEANVYHPDDAFNNSWGIGLRPFFRFYPVNQTRFRLYIDSGAGLLLFNKPFPQPTTGYGAFSEPRTGTRLNGSPKYGLGVELNLNEHTAIMAGVRHVHISNGNHPGQERNPGHDSNGFYVGFSYGLPK